MIPWLDLREANLRLDNINKAIEELGGEDSAPAQLLGQRDMIQYEIEWEKERCQDWKTGSIVAVIMGIVFYLWIFVLDKQ
jgi:hypothetical protein